MSSAAAMLHTTLLIKHVVTTASPRALTVNHSVATVSLLTAKRSYVASMGALFHYITPVPAMQNAAVGLVSILTRTYAVMDL